jgi:hypothetical protein
VSAAARSEAPAPPAGPRRRTSGPLIGGLVAAVVLGVLARACAHRPLELAAVRRVAGPPGTERLEARLVRGFTPAGRLVVLYVDPSTVALELTLNPEGRPLRELAAGAHAVSNGGFFTPERRPTGLLMSAGRALAPLVRSGGAAGSGVLVVDGGEVRLLPREAAGRADLSGASIAVQGGPRVIEDDGAEGIRSDDGERANRTVLGRDRRGRLALAVTHDEDGGAARGPSLHELMRLLGPAGLGRVEAGLAFGAALNLDGGPSTGLSLRADEGAIELPEGVPAVSAVVIRAAGAPP